MPTFTEKNLVFYALSNSVKNERVNPSSSNRISTLILIAIKLLILEIICSLDERHVKSYKNGH